MTTPKTDALMALADRYAFHIPGSQHSDEARAVLLAALQEPTNAVPVVELPDMRDSGYSVDGIEIKTLTYPQLFAYGDARALAGREQAIEECAAECLVLHANGNYKHDTREDCHDAIRALAASPKEQQP